MEQVLNLDIHEYKLLCEAQHLKNIDREYWIHAQAFANNRASLRDKKGRLVYRRMNELFDYEKELENASSKTKEKKESPQIRAMKEYLKKKKGG
ncbi:hypothetical protein [Faecalibaculum rodentium]|uniref:hypothetical protein n=1 Tax=Faecalibaculum rodentium TaxID=1702221 RepID=UPI0023F2B384|nr:hypothetical protein [Faecalibaculum rodentium]